MGNCDCCPEGMEIMETMEKNDANLGAVFQEMRKSRGFSLRQLAAETGLTASMLSQIERDLVNPSINTLRVIAKALDVPMYKFFLGETVDEQLVVRKGGRLTIGRPETDDIIYELLTPKLNEKIEFCMMHVPPHNNSSTLKSQHAGDEVAYVVNGSIKLFVNEVLYELGTGDSVMMPAGSIHRWQNDGEETVDVLFAVTPASF